ncbi:MAG TPA: Flp family type IVb pilin [Terracidiphilus sp.]|nr:Flp family type IVb pilin [Terracidiphilus sp.]
MRELLTRIYIVTLNNLSHEDGQDLVEYALVVALIAFGAVAGMGALSTEINKAFNDISSDLAKSLT